MKRRCLIAVAVLLGATWTIPANDAAVFLVERK